MPEFKRIPTDRFEDFYRKIVPVFCKFKEIVYTDAIPSGPCYLLYHGQCKIQKNLRNTTKVDASIVDMKLLTVMNLEKGDFSGLESLVGVKNYQYNLVVLNFLFFIFRLLQTLFYLKLTLVF